MLLSSATLVLFISLILLVLKLYLFIIIIVLILFIHSLNIAKDILTCSKIFLIFLIEK